MTTRTESCAERLPSHLAGRLGDIRTMLDIRAAVDEDNDLGTIDEYPLGSEVRYALRVELGTGGPADYFEAIVSGRGTVEKIAYHFADWGDHAQESLTGPDFETVATFLEQIYALDSLSEYVS